MINKTSILARLYQLPQYLRKTEKIIILILLAVIFIFTALFVFDRFLAKKTIMSDFGGTYIEAEVGELRTTIPILKQNDVEKDISKLIFSSLVKFNQKREVIGDLAKNWEISPDGKAYTFYLNEAKWHDGANLTADDVVFTFSLIQNEQFKSPFFESFKGVEVKKIDDKTISFVLKNPFAPFLTSLIVDILPKHFLSQVSPTEIPDSQFAKKPIGSGPFKLEKIEKNEKVTSVLLEVNKDYYQQKPYLSKLIIKIFPSSDEAQNALSQKQVMGFLNGKASKMSNHQVVLPHLKIIFFNLNQPLDKDFRRALILATNKTEIIENVGRQEKIDFPILPGFLGYKETERWNFDLEKAKQFLAKSKNHPSEINLLTNLSEENQQIAVILKKQWESLGITLNITILTNAHFEKAKTERNYDLILISISQKADSDPYPFWHSSQNTEPGLNFSSFKNREVDKLIEEARQSLDLNFRKQKYERFIDIIQSEVPAIFLYQSIYNYSVSDKIKGIEDIQGVTRSDRFWNIEKWYIKTKRVKIKG